MHRKIGSFMAKLMTIVMSFLLVITLAFTFAGCGERSITSTAVNDAESLSSRILTARPRISALSSVRTARTAPLASKASRVKKETKAIPASKASRARRETKAILAGA